MSRIHNLTEWFKDSKYWFKWYVKDPYLTLRCWFRHCFNKTHWSLIKSAFKGYPFDYGYLDEIEELKLKEMLEYHQKSHIVAEPDRTHDIIRTLTWAYNLRHKLNNETDLYHYEGGIKTEPLSGNTELYEVKTDVLEYHYDGPYVNWRNAKRFLNEYQLNNKYYRNHPEDYYLTKVRHLYYLIRERYTEYWWD